MLNETFVVTIEVVPPDGPDPAKVLSALESLKELPFYGFNVATNPVAKPRMSAMALCAMIQQRTKKPAILHLTTRDHNRLSLQGELWGTKALGIDTVMVATGDFVAFERSGEHDDRPGYRCLRLGSFGPGSGAADRRGL
jgi:methylenetetrahydrofolate reductase (NADPH)